LHLFLSQDDFVILLLAHLPLKVLLLDPDTTIILFFLGGQALVECGLAVSHVFSPLLDAPPALFEGLVSFVQLVLVVLLASLDSLQFFLFSVHVELSHRLLLFQPFLLFVLNFLSLFEIVFEYFHVVCLALLRSHSEFGVYAVGQIAHVLLQVRCVLGPELLRPLHSSLVSLQTTLNRLNFFDLVNLLKSLLCSTS